MNVKGFVVLFIVILKVVSVKSVCDDYLSCLGSFFSDFFNQKDKPPPLDSVIARNTESRNVDVDTEELDQILHDVSGFLKEELEVHPNMDLNSLLFKQIHNQTAIYVKTFDIGNDYIEDRGISDEEEFNFGIDYQNTEKSIGNTSVINLNVTINGKIFNITHEEVSTTAPFFIDSVGRGFTPSVLTIEPHNFNTTKDERKNEINTGDDLDLYNDNEDNATDYPILDYIEFYKDTTNEYVNLEPTDDPNVRNLNRDINSPLTNEIINSTLESETKGYASNFVADISSTVFPWLAAIFIKNDTTDQFDYYCDGVLLSRTAVITAARCVQKNNSMVKEDDLIVLFGKTSLKTVGDNEKVARIRTIKTHEGFTIRNQGNDLAVLITEEPVTTGDSVHPATLGEEEIQDQAATTGWATTGELTPIALETREKIACGDEPKPAEDTFCAVYGNDITVCPSYGGVYVTRAPRASWRLRGIRTGDPDDRGLCFNRNVAFTSLAFHLKWIKQNID